MSRSLFHIVPLSLALWLGGCATTTAPLRAANCEQFEAARKKMNYATEYRRDSKEIIKPSPLGPSVIATRYELQLDTKRTTACSHVTIHKELVLARRDDPNATIEESREFFAQDGTRIAVKNENLTSQLRQIGRYTASVPLPIPKGAPTGTYRLISTLKSKSRNGAETILAKDSASFEVVSPAR